VLLPDSGRNYLSKIFDDDWMLANGFVEAERPTTRDVLEARSDQLPALVRVHPDASAREAIKMLRMLDVSQLVVASQEPPLQAKEIEGSVRELELMHEVTRNPAVLDRPVSDVQSPPLPTVGVGEPVARIVELLDQGPAVVVLDGGRPCSVLTRSDVLAFLSERAKS
jgi:cystathionine beta-synthase